MQKVTIAEVKTKSGEKHGKPWSLVIVKDSAGVEYTSFDKGLEELGPGSVIEFEPDIASVDGKTKINIKDGWRIISKAAPPGPSGGTSAGASAAADPATVLLEIDARARATALILAGDLAKDGKIKVDDILSWSNTFYAWLRTGAARATPAVPAAAAGPPKSAPAGKTAEQMTTDELAHELFDKKDKKPARDAATIQNLGQLFQACKDDFNMGPDAVAKELGYSSREQLTGGRVADFYRTIAEIRRQ